MKTDTTEALDELDRIESCCDALDDISAALKEARNREPGWFAEWLRKAAKEAKAKEQRELSAAYGQLGKATR